MRATYSFVAFISISLPIAGYATAGGKIDKATVQAERTMVKGNIDKSHDLVVRIERGDKPIEWRTSGGGSEFEVVVEASDKVPLDGGKTGHGFVVTTSQGANKDVTKIALTQGNPIVGTFAIRRQADFVTKDGVLTFADITLKDGKKLPVSLRLERNKR